MTSALTRWSLILVTLAGLVVDAYVHFDLASTYDNNATSTLSQGDLFRVEAVLAIVAAAALLVRPRRYTAALAALVAGGGAILLLVYRYADIGAFGPIPSMYEPIWFHEKTFTFVAQAVAGLTALALVALLRTPAGSRRPAPTPA